ncbi:MAG: TolB family protein [Acidimicrobiia bacterium]
MTDRLDFEQRLEERLRARGTLAARPFDAAAIAHQAVAAAGPRRRSGPVAWLAPRPAFAWLIVAVLLTLALAGAVTLAGALTRQHAPVPPPVVSNGWIAYSTSTSTSRSISDPRLGSDIYLVKTGVKPILVAGRADGSVWNLCPAFSPDGRRLAFSVSSNQDRAIVVVGVDASGVSSGMIRISVPGAESAACPRWSSDGTRVAYLDGDVVVVRGLDGSSPAGLAGDPRIQDFSRPSLPIWSPAGDRMVWFAEDGALSVWTQVGTDTHSISFGLSPYAIAAWSPDSRQVLLMFDVGGGFSIQAVEVERPDDVTMVVAHVPVNDDRSWPGWGDVSWQPVFP